MGGEPKERKRDKEEGGRKEGKEGWFQKGCFEGTGCLHHGCDPVSHRPALLLVRPQHLPGSHRDPSGVWVDQGLRNLFPTWLLWLHQNVSAVRVFSDAQALYSLGLCRRDSPGKQSEGHKECHPALGLNQVTTTTTTPRPVDTGWSSGEPIVFSIRCPSCILSRMNDFQLPRLGWFAWGH